jgi:hypothetical protein
MIRRITCIASASMLLAVASAVVFAMEPSSAQTPVFYQVTMAYGGFGPAGPGTPDVGMSDSLFRGTATAQLGLVGNELVVRGRYARLKGPILADVAEGIHIHHDPGLFHLETIVAGLPNSGQDEGMFVGTTVLTNNELQMLAQGRLYMDIHTTAFPEGELRGMIVPALVEMPAAFVPPDMR